MVFTFTTTPTILNNLIAADVSTKITIVLTQDSSFSPTFSVFYLENTSNGNINITQNTSPLPVYNNGNYSLTFTNIPYNNFIKDINNINLISTADNVDTVSQSFSITMYGCSKFPLMETDLSFSLNYKYSSTIANWIPNLFFKSFDNKDIFSTSFTENRTVINFDNINFKLTGSTSGTGSSAIYRLDTSNYINIMDTMNVNNSPTNTLVLNITPVSCYLEGTKILCLVNDIEDYVPIEKLNKNTIVKTYLHGYKKINSIGKHYIYNDPSNKSNNCLYKMNKIDDKFDDLIITGGHFILEDKLSENELIKYNELGNDYKIDDKIATTAANSDKFSKITDVGNFTIYHFALESDNQYQMYGIYANGILSESTSIHYYNSQNFISID